MDVAGYLVIVSSFLINLIFIYLLIWQLLQSRVEYLFIISSRNLGTCHAHASDYLLYDQEVQKYRRVFLKTAKLCLLFISMNQQ